MEDFQRIAHAVLQRAAIFVGAPIGQRRDEGRQQIAVRAMEFEHVEAGALRHFGRRNELIAHAIHIGAIHRLGRAGCAATRRIGDAASTGQLPALSGASISSQPSWVEPFGAGMAELAADFGVGLGVHEIDDALPGAPRAPAHTCPCSRA